MSRRACELVVCFIHLHGCACHEYSLAKEWGMAAARHKPRRAWHRQFEVCLLVLIVLSGCASSQAHRNATVYVYTTEDSPSLKQLLSCKRGDENFLPQHHSGQWGTDIRLHQWLSTSVHRVQAPEDADFFFVPSYAKCLNDHGVISIDGIDAVLQAVLDELPFFRCAVLSAPSA